MDLSTAKRELKTLVQSLLDEEILDIQFIKLQDLQDKSNPKFIAEVVTLFLNDAQKIIEDFGHYMSQNDINFTQMNPYIHQIKGSSSSIGARRMTLACDDLLQAAKVKEREMCLQALNKIKIEYLRLQGKLCTIVQLENTIFSIESNGGRSADISIQRR